MIPRRKQNQAGGFSLVELLVVIGILAILLGLSFPAFRMAIAHANIAKCSSNLRQIGTGMIAFAGDNNGFLPASGGAINYGSIDAPPPGGSGQYGWTQQLEPYVGTNKTIFQCPDSSTISSLNNSIYGYFNGAHAAMAQSGVFGPVSLAKIRSTSQHIMGGDIAFNDFQKTDCDKDDYTQDPAFNEPGGGTIVTHLGSVNILFADGHVENLKKFDPTTMTTVYQGPGAIYNYNYPSP